MARDQRLFFRCTGVGEPLVDVCPPPRTPYGSCHGITGTDEMLLKGDPSTTFVL